MALTPDRGMIARVRPRRHQDAITFAPSSLPSYATSTIDLAMAHIERFDVAPDIADLDAAIGTLREAIPHAQPDPPTLASAHHILGTTLRVRSEHTATPADFDAVVDAFEAAYDLTPSDDPLQSHRLNELNQTREAQRGNL